MGTRWSVRLAARAVPAGLVDAIEQALAGVIAEMSQWEADSHLSRFNRAAPGWVRLPRDLARVLERGLHFAAQSDGAFDPTIGALSELWGFGATPATCAPPAPRALAAAGTRGGWRQLALDRDAGRARQPGGLALDLAGIAKGFAVDRIAEVVTAQGCHDFLAEIGGELVGRGIMPDGQPWWVAIEPPPGADLTPTRVALHGRAVATSGNHRRFFDHDGRRYAHSIDPRTGAPIDNDVVSVTVLHERCVDADALATTLTVLGLEDGLAFASRHNVATLIVTEREGKFVEHLSPALAALARMSEEARLACAVLATLAWLGFTGWMLRGWWRRQDRRDAKGLLVAYASQTGFAARIAEATAATLGNTGQEVALLPLGQVDTARLTGARRALFVAATTGEGDPPDDAARFVARVMQGAPPLAGLHYAVLALGDHNYRNFCAFGHALDRWLADQGAVRVADLIEVDAADPGALRHWQQNLGLFGAAADAPDWAPPAYRAGRLAARTHLNPGSPGEATFHLAIAPDAPVDWAAGDIVEIYPGDAAKGLSGTPALPHRDYSIASLPGDGAIELVVRRMRRADGALGLGSGWLTQEAEEGAAIAFRVRRNPSFHAPAPDRPMVLIGSGTGIAGLRAHLKARPPGARNWLLFGERSAGADALFADELAGWQEDGRLARLDRCFSRDGGGYVQDLLIAHHDLVRAWARDNAAFYVCGSVSGMAAGVDAALATILGRPALDALTANGGYRRDVY